MINSLISHVELFQSENNLKMDFISVDFISKFHNLEGDLIGERKKNFSKLLRKTVFSNEAQLNLALENLHPESYQESLFRIDALIYHRKTVDLIQTLKEGNEVLISKILKETWFFEEAFEDISVDDFVNEFLPCVSYVVRLKILKKLSKCWYEDKMDALFDSINKRYGLYVASRMCHACTCRKIEEILDEFEINLFPSQVLHILNKSNRLFLKHLKSLAQRCLETYGDQKVLKQLARNNLKLLLSLEKSNEVSVLRKSKNISRKILALAGNQVNTDVEYYIKSLHHRTLVRTLGSDFGALYRILCPKAPKQIDPCANYFKLLLYYPARKRWNFFSTTFFEIWPGSSLEELLNKIDDSILRLEPKSEVIYKWAEIHYDKSKNDDMLVYFDTTKCFSLIKKRIEVTSNKETRLNLVKILIRNCCKYDDFDFLEKVLEYICLRHRNEDAWFRLSVLEEIYTHVCLDRLNENHWKHIYEQIKILRIKKFVYFGEWLNVLQKYMEFLAKNDYDLKDPLMEFVDFMVQLRDQMIYVDVSDGAAGNKIMSEMWNVLPEMHINEEEKVYLQSEVIRGIIHFSLKHPGDYIKLTDFPDIIEVIQKSLTKNDDFLTEDLTIIEYVFQYNLVFPENAVAIEESRVLELLLQITKQNDTIFYFKDMIKTLMKKNRTSLENDILHLYFDKLYGFYPQTNEIALWFLKNEPRTVTPYFNTILGMYMDISSLKQFKQYSHLGFDRVLSAFYKKTLIENEDVKMWKTEAKVLNSLSVLLPTDEFLAYVRDYLSPSNLELFKDEEKAHVLKIQSEVAKLLHKVIEPSKVLTFLMNVCPEEHLKLQPLQSVFYRSIEKRLYSQVRLLSKRAEPLKRHALHLSCELLEQNYLINSFLKDTENDLYSRKYLFPAAVKSFLKNQSKGLLDSAYSIHTRINTSENVNVLLRNIKIPLNYRRLYVKKFWCSYDNSSQIRVDIKYYLKYLSADILKSLSFRFIEDVIIWIFNLEDKRKPSDFACFVMKLLQISELENDRFFNLVFENLSKQLDSCKDQFFHQFLQAVYHEKANRSFVDKFVEFWKSYFGMVDSFREHIALDLLVSHLDNDVTEKFAEGVVLLLDKFLNDFGYLVFELFESQLRIAIENIENFNRYIFFYSILKYKFSIESCILVLNLLSSNLDKRIDGSYDQIYSEVIEELQAMDDPMVKICLRKHLYSVSHYN